MATKRSNPHEKSQPSKAPRLSGTPSLSQAEDLSGLPASFTNLAKDFKDAEARIEALQSQVEAHNPEVEDLTRDLVDTRAERDAAEDALETLLAEFRAQANEVRGLRLRAEQVEREAKRLRIEIKQEKNKVNRNMYRNARLTGLIKGVVDSQAKGDFVEAGEYMRDLAKSAEDIMQGAKKANGISANVLSLEKASDGRELGGARKKYTNELGMLREMFPDWTESARVSVLHEVDGDIPAAVDKITRVRVKSEH